jgi:hypothetical protein
MFRFPGKIKFHHCDSMISSRAKAGKLRPLNSLIRVWPSRWTGKHFCSPLLLEPEPTSWSWKTFDR